MRIDKLLWFLRLAKTRALAQAMVAAGHIRRNGARIERAHQAVGVGDILVIPLGLTVRVIEVLSLPPRRGPASEALACYRLLGDDGPSVRARDMGNLDVAGHSPIAAGASNDARVDLGERDLQP